MRFTGISIAAALLIGVSATPALAQQSAFDSCASLSEQRGAGVESGRRNHIESMRDCLACKQIPAPSVGSAAAPAPAAHLDSYNKCEALSEQRGAGTDSGRRNHREFMAECMAGTIR